MLPDQLVPRRLGPEHGDPQLTARGDAGIGEGLLGDQRLGVAELLEAERVAKRRAGSTVNASTLPSRWMAAIAAALATVRGLTDAARTASDDDLLAESIDSIPAVGGSPRPA